MTFGLRMYRRMEDRAYIDEITFCSEMGYTDIISWLENATVDRVKWKNK